MKRRGKAIRIEYETEAQRPRRRVSASRKKAVGHDVENSEAQVSTSKQRVPVSRPPKGSKGKGVKGEEEKPMWLQHIENLEQMRSKFDAPVDTMGCHMIGDVLAPPKVYRLHVLVSLMLSSQTKDQITAAAMQRLKAHGLTIDSLIDISETELQNLLVPVGFYKRKAVYLKKVASILREEYDDDIPDTVKGLCALPGVGPKMAHLAMQHAWDRIEGLGVDTHVHRIANRLAWVKTSTPEQTRVALETLIPQERWGTLNKLLVGFGQQTCLPVLPRCSQCLNKDLCPAVGVTNKRVITQVCRVLSIADQMQTIVERSKPPLRDAVALDKDDKKMEAVAKYVEGISILMEAMSCDEVSSKDKDALEKTISKYMARAESLKGQAKVKIDSLEQRRIKEGTTGHGYDKIFAKCMDDALTEVMVEDAYIIAHHQVVNFVRFCEFCVLHARNLRCIGLRTQREGQNAEALGELARSLALRQIQLNILFDSNIHDREIRFNNGWIVKIGRGLDYFRNPGRYGLGAGDLNLRQCHETNVDIFRMR